MIGDSIRAIIDLLKIKKDARKADLEISKLEREGQQAASLIQRVSLEDIKRYDPKTRRIEQIAEQQYSTQTQSVGSLQYGPYRPLSRTARILGTLFFVAVFAGLIFLIFRGVQWIYRLVF